MVGFIVRRIIESKWYSNIIRKTSAELDLRTQQDVFDFYNQEKLEVVIDTAEKFEFILPIDTLDFPSTIKYSNNTEW